MEVVVLISDKIYLGIVTTKTGHVKCLKHHVNYRPEFYPISLNPRMARAMINVAGIKNKTIEHKVIIKRIKQPDYKLKFKKVRLSYRHQLKKIDS